MKQTFLAAAFASLVLCIGCGVHSIEAGPTKTTTQEIDAGKAETVQAEIRMGGGELYIEGGASKLMSGTFRFSEDVGEPTVRYDVTGASGRLDVTSPKGSSSAIKTVNEWKLRMGSAMPLALLVALGGGQADLDMTKLALKSLEVQIGAGEMTLNLAGNYGHDVDVHVTGGAGSTRIRLPKDMGVVLNATVGIGDLKVNGLTKRDGSYYNDAWAQGKPALHMNVKGAVGDITLTVE